jgi:hypothetical protein
MTADREAAIREALERDDMMAVSVPWLRGSVDSLLAELAAAREREEAATGREMNQLHINNALHEREQTLREALQLVADKPFIAALDAREMKEIARDALAATEGQA